VKKVSIIGASGFIGSRLLRHLAEVGRGRVEVTGTGFTRAGGGLARLDVTDRGALAAHLEQAFDLVVLLAGTKDVARCEREPAWAEALNAEPVEEVLRLVRARGLGTRVVFLSSDHVFAGDRGQYRDDDPTEPCTVYGRTKALGEQAVLAAPGPHTVVRSAAVLGRGAVFLEWLLQRLRSPGEVPLYTDVFNTPTPLGLLVELLGELLLAPEPGDRRIVHLVGDRRLSRWETGVLVAGLVGGVQATLVGARHVPGADLLQHDLSMLRSPVACGRRQEGLEAGLRRELAGG